MAGTAESSFLTGFGITFPGKSETKQEDVKMHTYINTVKGLSYVPIAGTIVLIACVVFLALNDEDEDKTTLYVIAATISRAALSIAGPIFLLPLDFIGTILYAVRRHQNKSENPIFAN